MFKKLSIIFNLLKLFILMIVAYILYVCVDVDVKQKYEFFFLKKYSKLVKLVVVTRNAKCFLKPHKFGLIMSIICTVVV